MEERKKEKNEMKKMKKIYKYKYKKKMINHDHNPYGRSWEECLWRNTTKDADGSMNLCGGRAATCK